MITPSYSVLIIEDEKNILDFMTKALKANNYKVFTAVSGNAGLALITSQCPDVVLLDLGLPDIDGNEIISSVRQWTSCPIIVVSARSSERDKVTALDLGADDYITKPFSLSVLRARVNTQLRKAESLQAHTSASVYRKGCYEFDFERMIFLVDGQEIELSKTEQRLLRLLVQNEGINLRRDFLLDRVWNDSAEFVDANALSVSVKRLRDKLGIPDSIKTVYGIGYRFE